MTMFLRNMFALAVNGIWSRIEYNQDQNTD